MIKIERTKELPPELAACFSEVALAEGPLVPKRLKSFIALSSDVRYATENGVPLFIIGAFRPSLLSSGELWMYASTNLRARHFRELRRLIWEWIEAQSFTVFARAKVEKSARMLEFLGFALIGESGGLKIYEAKR